MSMFDTLESRRLMAFGTVITAYGTGGTGTAPSIGTSDNDHAEAITLSSGKTLAQVGGGLARFNTDGSLDTGFGTDGVTGFRGVNTADAAVDGSGRIYTVAANSSGTLVQRYTANGKLDSGFGTNGTVLVESNNGFHASRISVAGDGKIVVAGTYRTGTSDTGSSVVTRVYRLTGAGAKDTGFSGDGMAEFKLGVDDLVSPLTGDNVVDVRTLASGKIEVLGASYNSSSGDSSGNSFVALACLTASGALDTDFGKGGVARQGTFDGFLTNDAAGVIRVDGSAVVAATSISYENVDTAFVGLSAAGKTLFTTHNTSAPYYAADAAALADGRTAFVSDDGHAWIVSAAGEIGNAVRPLASDTDSGSDAVAVTSDGDLVLVNNDSPYVRATKIDAGKATDARPDNLPNAAVIDTAVDADGGLHVAYFDTASKTLKYAYRNAQGYWGGIRTVDATVGSGAAISIETFKNAAGKTFVGIAYYTSESADLRLAVSSDFGKKFALDTVASKGAVGLNPTFHFTDGGGYAVTFHSKTTGGFYYALNTGTGWGTELIDDKTTPWSDFEYDPTTRRPAVAYAKTDGSIYYAFKAKGKTWAQQLTKVTDTPGGAAFINLNVPYDAAYGLRVSYYDLAGADLRLASFYKYADAGKQWTTQAVATKGVVGAYSTLAPSYYSGSGDTLYAWSKTGDAVYRYEGDYGNATFSTTRVATGGGRFLSVAFDSSGTTVALAYQDTASGLTFVR